MTHTTTQNQQGKVDIQNAASIGGRWVNAKRGGSTVVWQCRWSNEMLYCVGEGGRDNTEREERNRISPKKGNTSSGCAPQQSKENHMWKNVSNPQLEGTVMGLDKLLPWYGLVGVTSW